MRYLSSFPIHSKLGNYTAFLSKLDPQDVINQIETDSIIIADSFFKTSLSLPTGNTVWVEATEEAKTFTGLASVIDQVLHLNPDRRTRLVAVGGGVIQDITCFIASILFRGLKWEYIPTTLLSQGDSCIGGKSSINFGEVKNRLGTFHPPSKIIIAPSFLRTLPEEQICSGLGEMLHFSVIDSRDNLAIFRKFLNVKKTYDNLSDLITHTLLIKRTFIEEDEFDGGVRLLLNYGHTFGHAIEACLGYSIPHGIAVAHGMLLENRLSNALGFLSNEHMAEVNEVIGGITGNYPLPSLDKQKLLAALIKDKKSIKGKVGVVLLRDIGDGRMSYVDHDSINKFVSDL